MPVQSVPPVTSIQVLRGGMRLGFVELPKFFAIQSATKVRGGVYVGGTCPPPRSPANDIDFQLNFNPGA